MEGHNLHAGLRNAFKYLIIKRILFVCGKSLDISSAAEYLSWYLKRYYWRSSERATRSLPITRTTHGRHKLFQIASPTLFFLREKRNGLITVTFNFPNYKLSRQIKFQERKQTKVRFPKVALNKFHLTEI